MTSEWICRECNTRMDTEEKVETPDCPLCEDQKMQPIVNKTVAEMQKEVAEHFELEDEDLAKGLREDYGSGTQNPYASKGWKKIIRKIRENEDNQL